MTAGALKLSPQRHRRDWQVRPAGWPRLALRFNGLGALFAEAVAESALFLFEPRFAKALRGCRLQAEAASFFFAGAKAERSFSAGAEATRASFTEAEAASSCSTGAEATRVSFTDAEAAPDADAAAPVAEVPFAEAALVTPPETTESPKMSRSSTFKSWAQESMAGGAEAATRGCRGRDKGTNPGQDDANL